MSNTPNKDKLIHLRVILKSGAEFTTVVKDYSFQWNRVATSLTSFQVKECVENFPVFVDLNEVVAVVRVFSNEERGESSE